ncbi:MAG: class I SAM-dependent methyltransferase [Micromonosporaceae bacterium]|nr:class I SAM-dependent methyltransferase [Micromonosporaceae bacterium]
MTTVEPAIGDAFGDVLRECWDAGAEAGHTFEVIERDDGLLLLADAARYFAGANPWSTHEAAILPLATGRVLDIGCGAGRHLAALGDRCQPEGIDPSPGAVQVCRARGLAARVADIDHLPAGAHGKDAYDTLLLFGNNLGLLGSPEAAPGRLAGLAAVAAPGARILGSTTDPYATTNPLHLRYHQRNREHGRPAGQLRLRVRHQAIATPWFDYWWTSVAELEQVLAGSPWRLSAIERDPGNAGRYAAVLMLR